VTEPAPASGYRTKRGERWTRICGPGTAYKGWQHDAVKFERSSRPASIFAAAATATGRSDATPYSCATPTPTCAPPSSASLQEIAEQLGHTVEVLARNYTDVIAECAAARALSTPSLDQRARAS
jgi:hypothetical protein